ncbi:SidA/IucD/PvdA family monooxygenase [Serratia rubidaea]|nr:SidA/IucD/PvdA family monooxygenase [Serratia rubidaea]
MNGNGHYPIIGIGFGPSNIALAITLEEVYPSISCLFLEGKASSEWQEGLLLADSDIQNHPLRDLATPRNPRSHYSFTNYLFEKNRLFEHLNMGLYYPYRYEYRDYIRWAAEHFDGSVEYSTTVVECNLLEQEEGAHKFELTTNTGKVFTCDNLVVATGRTPYIPHVLEGIDRTHLVHGTNFKSVAETIALGNVNSVAVVGGSQSAVEIILYLANTFPQMKIHAVSRKFGYRLKDTSPFTGEVYFPDFVDMFYDSKAEHKQRLKDDLNLTNYSASDADVLDELYRLIYRDKHFGSKKLSLHNSVEVLNAVMKDSKVSLELATAHSDEKIKYIDVDLVVSATGFRDIGLHKHQEKYPPLFNNIYPYIKTDEFGEMCIKRDYSVELVGSRLVGLYLNGLCESSHGMGDAGSLSLVSIRSKQIAESINNRFTDINRPTYTLKMEV